MSKRFSVRPFTRAHMLRDLDAGIRFTENVPPDMIAVPCSPPLRHAVFASLAYFDDRKLAQHPDDLAAHDCIRARMASGMRYHWEFERSGDAFSVDVPGKFTLNNQTLMVRGVGLMQSHFE